MPELNPYPGEPERANWDQGYGDGYVGNRRRPFSTEAYHFGYDCGIVQFRVNQKRLPSQPAPQAE